MMTSVPIKLYKIIILLIILLYILYNISITERLKIQLLNKILNINIKKLINYYYK